jgi:hypothetical protein
MKVLIITCLNAGSLIAFWKFPKPTKSPTTPAGEIWLKDSLKTIAMGNTIKMSISRMLGSSHKYGSHLCRTNTEFMDEPPFRRHYKQEGAWLCQAPKLLIW